MNQPILAKNITTQHIITTYTYGYRLISKKDITKNDIIILCNMLNKEFENESPKIKFVPEPITEGGIQFIFEGNERWYKSIRLGIRDKRGKWPYIELSTVFDEWNQNNDVVINKKNEFQLFLKAFHGAPVFTVDELKIFEKCFEQIGLFKKGAYPKKKNLTNEYFRFNMGNY